jgi:ABC-2 type transport system ATP-binding protein
MVETDGAVVATRRLTKIFRDFWLREKVTAVADLNLDIRPGEVFGLLGPNGSGKSTTLKMILGLLFPTRGTISVFGRLPTDVAIKSRIGFLPEESYLYPFLDARETLDFYGRLFRQPRRQRLHRIDMLLEMVGLGSVAYRRVGEYSKGMQRRIGLAQALINDPDLLILDEPTSGMDPIGTRQFKDLIETLGMRGKTVILSSHLLADVEDVCDRVCILYGGRQRAEGDIADLLVRRGLTQITTQQLDEQTLEAVRRQLAAAGKTIVDVTSPHDKLESLFLRIVQEAQDQRLATGGALAGGQVAEFLRGQAPAGKKILEQLVAAAEVPPPASAPQAPPSSTSPTQTRQSVLEELLGKDKDKVKKPPPPREP